MFSQATILNYYATHSKSLANEKCRSEHNSPAAREKAIATQIAALRLAIEHITKYRLESDYSPNALRAKIQQLEASQARLRRGMPPPSPNMQKQGRHNGPHQLSKRARKRLRQEAMKSSAIPLTPGTGPRKGSNKWHSPAWTPPPQHQSSQTQTRPPPPPPQHRPSQTQTFPPPPPPQHQSSQTQTCPPPPPPQHQSSQTQTCIPPPPPQQTCPPPPPPQHQLSQTQTFPPPPPPQHQSSQTQTFPPPPPPHHQSSPRPPPPPQHQSSQTQTCPPPLPPPPYHRAPVNLVPMPHPVGAHKRPRTNTWMNGGGFHGVQFANQS